MPNTYFRFKQFIVQQDKTTMKVCTDSCLFGAWVADEIGRQNHITRVLDIGTGTGLLSLMLAQKLSNIYIDAIEVDASSAQQARDNFFSSIWKDRLQVYECRIQDFTTEKKYDFIIANPPFFADDLLSKLETKNIAHHNTNLSLLELMNSIKTLLSDEGSFVVLLPYRRTKEFESLASEALYFVNKKVIVKPTKDHSYFRSMLLFSREKKKVLQEEIVIKNEYNEYSSAFILLLKDYYLYL